MASEIPTQAMVTRCVKAAIRGAQESGLTVTGYEVTFNQGVPAVRVTTAPESASPAPVNTGGVDVEALKARIRGRHERRP